MWAACCARRAYSRHAKKHAEVRLTERELRRDEDAAILEALRMQLQTRISVLSDGIPTLSVA